MSSGSSGSAPQTASAAARSNPPTKTLSRSRTICSFSCNRSYDQFTSARSVCWRSSATRLPPVSSLNRSCRRALICSDRQRAHARRRQFQRQRNAFEPGAQLGDGRRLVLRQREVRFLQPRAFHEQLHGIRAQESLRARLSIGNRAAETRDRFARPGCAMPRDSSRGSGLPARPEATRRPGSRTRRSGARSCRGSTAACVP